MTAVDGTRAFEEMAWIQWLGIVPLRATDAEVDIRLDPRNEQLNHNGTVNAAILFGLAEVAGAGAVVAGMLDMATAAYTVVKRASIEYRAPARGTVVAAGRVDLHDFRRATSDVAAGRPVEVDAAVTIADADGHKVATASFAIAVRPRRDQ